MTTRRKDGDYLTLGWWLEVPNDERGRHQFSPYYAGRDPFTTNAITDLTGSASYEGPAAGKYATRVAGSDTAQKGVFTATANLTAEFDASNMVSGRITDFMDETGSPLVGNWNVVLDEVTHCRRHDRWNCPRRGRGKKWRGWTPLGNRRLGSTVLWKPDPRRGQSASNLHRRSVRCQMGYDRTRET